MNDGGLGGVGFRGRRTVSDMQTQLSHVSHAECYLHRFDLIADRDRCTVGRLSVDHVCGAPSRPIRPVTIDRGTINAYATPLLAPSN